MDVGNATSIGAQSIELTLKLLAPYEGESLTIERRESSIVVSPKSADTFAITLYDQGDEAMIGADRWHTHYDNHEQAAFCVLWLLTPYYRLVHELKGGVLAATWIECFGEQGWEGYDPVYFLNPENALDWETHNGEQFSRRYIQQDAVPPPHPFGELVPGAQLDENELPVDSYIGTHTVQVESAMGPTLF